MIFTQIPYALFFLAVFALHWAIPSRFRWWTLLAASLAFYASWGWTFLPTLLFVTACSFATGLVLARIRSTGHRRAVLAAGILLSLAPLLFFKYWNFLIQTVADSLSALGVSFAPPLAHLLVPAGISFFTFKAIGYAVDVHRGIIDPERNFLRYFLFISFFPAMISGPIDRAGTLLPQLSSPTSFDYGKAKTGALLFAWGLFLKLVVADPLSELANRCWADPSGATGGACALAAFAYTIQIYSDFSGYSNMAIGSAKMLGIDLAENFRNPYFATSLQDFWRRWHISLSTWFRDYVYIPLGGSRCSWLRHKTNLFLTFLASGLWHGAGWTFLIWGALHGAVIAIEAAAFPRRKGEPKPFRPPNWLMLPATFAVVALAWVFFRSESAADATLIIRKILGCLLSPVRAYHEAGAFALFVPQDIQRLLIPFLLLFARDLAVERSWHTRVHLPTAVRWAGYFLFTAFCVVHHMKWGVSSESFIYFNF